MNNRKEVAEMKRVGVLVGREKSFPEALIASINERGSGEVRADFIELGGIRHDQIPAYDLVVGRRQVLQLFISGEIGCGCSEDRPSTPKGLYQRNYQR